MLTDATSRQPPLQCGRRFPRNQLRPLRHIEAADRPFAWLGRALYKPRSRASTFRHSFTGGRREELLASSSLRCLRDGEPPWPPRPPLPRALGACTRDKLRPEEG